MELPQGLVDVILSETLTKEQKLEAIPRFAWDVVHMDGPYNGLIEQGSIPAEDADLICKAVARQSYKVEMINGRPVLLFFYTKQDLFE